MKFLTLFLLWLIVFCITNSKTEAASKVILGDIKVKLITSISEKKYIKADDDLYAVRLKLKLKFINQGNTPILFYKDWIAISHIWVSKSEKELLNQNFEQSSSQTFMTSEIESIDNLELKDFVILSKGDIFEAEEVVTLFSPYDSKKNISGAITSGNHVLQIKTHLWFWNEIDTEKVSKKFSKSGLIWTKPIISEPIDFCFESYTLSL